MFDGVPFGDLSTPALVGIFVVLVFFGLLVPRRTLQDKIREAENWRNAYEAERDARSSSDAQTRELLEVAKTTKHLIEALFEPARRVPPSGGTDVS